MKIEQSLTMSTREMLLELYGKEGMLTFQQTYTNSQNGQNGQNCTMFSLPKRETLILVSGYNLPMRSKLEGAVICCKVQEGKMFH